MLKLLLDEHISPSVATGLRRLFPSIQVHAIREWKSGTLIGEQDSKILRTAVEDRLTLVTFDLRTIPKLLKEWTAGDRDHGGIVFVDDKTIRPGKIGSLIRQLAKLYQESGQDDWTNRIEFLQKN